MTGAPPLWIKNPLAIVTDSAAVSGLVIADVVVFDASEHAVLPVLINTHQRLHKILPRAYPAALDQPPFPWLEALYPIWARLSPDSFLIGIRLAAVELLLSGITMTSDHHCVFPSGFEDATAVGSLEIAAALHDFTDVRFGEHHERSYQKRTSAWPPGTP
ncbi:MAG: hypothetical protein ACRBM6_37010 [Geminicoccales bacterium]